MKLTREHLRHLWKDNLIMGFCHRTAAEEMLINCAPGTFLLRFSDSGLGGISIAWIGLVYGKSEIIMISPFFAKNFSTRSLADSIHDLQQLTTLYPNIPKNEVFGKYYSLYFKPDTKGMFDNSHTFSFFFNDRWNFS